MTIVLELIGTVVRQPDLQIPSFRTTRVRIYLATSLFSRRAKLFRFRSGAEMLEAFGMQKGKRTFILLDPVQQA